MHLINHMQAYGVLAYETAYLKTYYPVEFMAIDNQCNGKY